MPSEIHRFLHGHILPPSLGHKSRSQRMRPEVSLQSRKLRAPLHDVADRLSRERLDHLGFADPAKDRTGLHAGGRQPRGERFRCRPDEGLVGSVLWAVPA